MAKLDREKEQTYLCPIPLQDLLTIARNAAIAPLWLEQRGCRDLVRVSLAHNYARNGNDWAISAQGIIHPGKQYNKTWRLWPKKPTKQTMEGYGWPR